MTWWRARFSMDQALVETAAWLLAERLDHPVETRDQSTMSRSGELSDVIIAFDNEPPPDIQAQIDAVLQVLGVPPVSIETQSSNDESWRHGWRAFFRGQSLAPDIWVGPPWEEKPNRKISIHIEPGLAFGTGTHATTQASLKVLAKHLIGEAPMDVLDVGCGSAVLSIGAAQLGHRVLGIDIDESALNNAEHNLRLNNVSDHVQLRVGSAADITDTYPVVVANILAPILVENAAAIMACCETTLILSGLMEMHLNDIVHAFYEFELVHQESQDEWLVLHLVRRSPWP